MVPVCHVYFPPLCFTPKFTAFTFLKKVKKKKKNPPWSGSATNDSSLSSDTGLNVRRHLTVQHLGQESVLVVVPDPNTRQTGNKKLSAPPPAAEVWDAVTQACNTKIAHWLANDPLYLPVLLLVELQENLLQDGELQVQILGYLRRYSTYSIYRESMFADAIIWRTIFPHLSSVLRSLYGLNNYTKHRWTLYWTLWVLLLIALSHKY